MAKDSDDDACYFPYVSRLDGTLVSIGTVRRNGKLVPRFDPSVYEPAESEEDEEEAVKSPSYLRFEDAALDDLDELNRRIARLAMVLGRTNGEIGQMIGVSRSAISQRLKRMARKNQAVRMWWRRQNKINQYR
jgi:RNA polymerase sigma factor (sigma-70 family)